MEVLKSKSEIELSRRKLVEMGISGLEGCIPRLLKRLRLSRGISFDKVKSWDILKTFQFVSENVGKDESILDIGSYASEILICLKKAGFRKLAGVDLNPDVMKMPFADEIKYVVADFMEMPFTNESFSAVTSISVIEHGLNTKALLAEISRVLKPKGYFIVSFDYWPEKIDTTGIKFFDMDWTIFSKDEVSNLCDEAIRHGLVPIGALNPPAGERTINCAAKEYTFAWIVFQKN